ncbi:hypothetical protein EN827_31105 [Mesorhizobium sp. M1D.F.Ca.ET.184.01.1.1]|nr:MAG: hypothetical protein EOQ76_30345 [Mesorhizobium sp.]TGP22280.1 hypothetical protein EN874_019395 [Mesorhizobium sp. M1D.F.Ca.ET.231.01.1.1]TGP24750.1 hypothetical protein EN877_30800 [Mesorhizobium sp. M1D.F.Ca.ET.234.01.1.1]TGS37353.1 hypothetical protein EN827_31105 [Mesorhizobium sp. M1D.F.Ca.ET.184.01.1.1]TGS58153.1 hypothetical protein EN826_031080 [Mesorhizobium sp. M1D.F.Ca.ET.183.01.1.1]
MAEESMDVQIVRLEERLKSIEGMLTAIADEQKAASEGRRRGYEAQERAEREMIGINFRLSAVEKSVEAIRPTTAELEKVRDRVVFAGSLGRVLWGVGKALISAAAGAAAVYYSMTGRPPP